MIQELLGTRKVKPAVVDQSANSNLSQATKKFGEQAECGPYQTAMFPLVLMSIFNFPEKPCKST
jgi:hypothetical protein